MHIAEPHFVFSYTNKVLAPIAIVTRVFRKNCQWLSPQTCTNTSEDILLHYNTHATYKNYAIGNMPEKILEKYANFFMKNCITDAN